MTTEDTPVIYREEIQPTPLTEREIMGVMNGNIFTAKFSNPWSDDDDYPMDVALSFPNYKGPTGMRARLFEENGHAFLAVYNEKTNQVMGVAVK